ncbi:hypothetical protein CEUSTIGMA_g3867.t1 [Chlamydomonas eustigma]|uniref:Uncharacterized protein n=1 Tax=Chlamydomonas eustigma TaxID=1157962 RepID=A0A250X0K3_9CHLO|nr:hypothetical protein CEUSTIGMA_g3867.t1 [Chlamydomonas eustigma]|eukprot:GAX76422.1 hypothetical protein CEUSTIGMA_g3867.t1 [Chlamydomonas eustigma]
MNEQLKSAVKPEEAAAPNNLRSVVCFSLSLLSLLAVFGCMLLNTVYFSPVKTLGYEAQLFHGGRAGTGLNSSSASPAHSSSLGGGTANTSATLFQTDHNAKWDDTWHVSIYQQLHAIQEGRRRSPLILPTGHIDEATGQKTAKAEITSTTPPALLILMLGDSTMEAQHKLLCEVLIPGCQYTPGAYSCRQTSTPTSTNHEVTPASAAVSKHLEEGSCINTALNVRAWYVKSGNCEVPESYLLDGLKSDEKASKGMEVVSYFTCGLWMLHLGNARHVKSDFRVDLKGALNLEDSLDHTLRSMMKVYGSNAMLVCMSAHSIAEAKFTGEYEQAVLLLRYKEKREKVVSSCVNLTQAFAEESNITSIRGDVGGQVQEFCEKALFMEEGMQYLNGRVRKFLKEWEKDAGRVVDVVDGHLITWQKSWATPVADGRHYPTLVPLECSQDGSAVESTITDDDLTLSCT